MEVVVTAGAIGRAKLQSNHFHQQTNSMFYFIFFLFNVVHITQWSVDFIVLLHACCKLRHDLFVYQI